jgi:hypothetical protein
MLLIEFLSVLIALGIASLRPTLGENWFARVERAFCTLAARRWLSVIVMGLTALTLRLALLPVLPIPEPIVHDEFGYLLAADTFAHGRVTNSTHPMWVHFETFSIIQTPTYQCFAQPAQGLFLALGQVVAGHPFWGVWLSAGLMCAALCWMLQGWMPARWALLGGFLAILRYSTSTYWGNSYWGGAVGALGGALVLGALPRIKRSQRICDALVMGIGLALLANSRPFEGFVLSLPVAIALFVWILGKDSPPLTVSFRRIVVPLGLLLAGVILAMTYYSWRVTGHPFQMPYQAERKQYAVAPYFLWQRLRPQPVYRDEELKKVYAHDEVIAYRFYRSWIGLLAKFVVAWRFYLGALLTFPLLMITVTLPYGFSWKQISKRTRFLILTCGLALVAMGVETFYSPHYTSPATGALLALVLLSMRHLQRWRWRGRRCGLLLTRTVPVICLALFVLRAVAGPFPNDLFFAQAWYQKGEQTFGRKAVLKELERFAGNQLVIVRYKPDHITSEEWVYNEPNIDASKVVWAREIDPAEDERLIRYFKDRRVWLLEADEKPPRLTEYPIPRSSRGSGQQ